MKALVTGATGVYGRAVVERLHRAGHEVVAMARNPAKSLPRGVRFARGDVADAAAVQAAMAGCDVVAHLAFVVTPLKSEAETRRINIGGTQNVLDAMKLTGARRLVFASSALSYGANPDNPPLFSEEHQQRPAPEYLYGSHKKEAEALIRQSGVEAVIARTAATVGRNIDNLLIDIFAGPAIVGVKDADVRYQLIHQDDVGRFLALACQEGPPGPVNVAPADYLSLREVAAILGKRYVEVSQAQVMRAVKFMWEHDLADITPGEASAISYLPVLATDRLEREWNFHCAWTTAEAVLDLRRAITGVASVAKRRIELPWRVRFPQQHPGEAISARAMATARPSVPAIPGELDTAVALLHPTYRVATTGRGPLKALTLTTHAYLVRAAVTGVLDAFGASTDERRLLGAAGAGIFGHRLYVNDDIGVALAGAPPWRRRVLSASYASEVNRLSVWASETLVRAGDLHSQTDERLEATLTALRDELAWFWMLAVVGAALDGPRAPRIEVVLAALGRGGSQTTRAHRTAAALGQALAAAVRERAGRMQASGAIADVEDVEHLTWDELLAPPSDLAAAVERRRAEHERLSELSVPSTISAVGAASAIKLSRKEVVSA
jgi:nucleoside-diphosphate-sugar epimerase